MTGGAHFIDSAPGTENPSYATAYTPNMCLLGWQHTIYIKTPNVGTPNSRISCSINLLIGHLRRRKIRWIRRYDYFSNQSKHWRQYRLKFVSAASCPNPTDARRQYPFDGYWPVYRVYPFDATRKRGLCCPWIRVHRYRAQTISATTISATLKTKSATGKVHIGHMPTWTLGLCHMISTTNV